MLSSRATDTQWRHKSKKSEILGRCGRQNVLRPYLKIWIGIWFSAVQWRRFPHRASVVLDLNSPITCFMLSTIIKLPFCLSICTVLSQPTLSLHSCCSGARTHASATCSLFKLHWKIFKKWTKFGKGRIRTWNLRSRVQSADHYTSRAAVRK